MATAIANIRGLIKFFGKKKKEEEEEIPPKTIRSASDPGRNRRRTYRPQESSKLQSPRLQHKHSYEYIAVAPGTFFQ